MCLVRGTRDLYSDKKQDETELAALALVPGLRTWWIIRTGKNETCRTQCLAEQQRSCEGLPLPTVKGAAAVRTHGDP